MNHLKDYEAEILKEIPFEEVDGNSFLTLQPKCAVVVSHETMFRILRDLEALRTARLNFKMAIDSHKVMLGRYIELTDSLTKECEALRDAVLDSGLDSTPKQEAAYRHILIADRIRKDREEKSK